MKTFIKIIFISLLTVIAPFLAVAPSVAEDHDNPAPQKKVLYYRHPMTLGVTSPVPAKDEMGMDYIPVYSDEGSKTTVAGRAAVSIGPDKQQMIGLRTATAMFESLRKPIRALGIVAHDEALYDAQMEYIQAIYRSPQVLKDTYTTAYQRRLAPLAEESAKLKLMQLGMDQQAVSAIKRTSRPDKRLLHLGDMRETWVYANVYESDIPFVKRGDAVEVTIASRPDLKFEGHVETVSSFADMENRTFKVRALVQDEKMLLKPEMPVNISIQSDLGRGLSVPAEAVLLTGERAIVFIEKEPGTFEPREVTLGAQIGTSYEVKAGLSEGEKVVVDGNFLLDSESRLKGAVAGAGAAS